MAQVARDEGGSVNVYQAEGGGALFRFSLPEVDRSRRAADLRLNRPREVAAHRPEIRPHGAKSTGRLGCRATWDP